MVWKKGYIGLSVSLLILFAALFLYPETAAAAQACYDYDCYSCYDYYDSCSSLQTGYDAYDIGRCPNGCVTRCQELGPCCINYYNSDTLYGCDTHYCGDGTCDSDEDSSSCPLYPDGSGGGDCDCNPSGRTCNGNGVFEHYSNCGGRQIIDDCVDVYGNGAYCSGGECYPYRDPCTGVSCYSPPSSYCKGATRVYFSSPGTCYGSGQCHYSADSYRCPTSGCNGRWRQSGGCSGGSCYMNNVEYCGDDGWGCQNSDTSGYLSRGCSGGSCYASWSSQQNCNNNNGWYDTSGCYGTCSGSTIVSVKNQQHRDYYCSSGNCNSYSVTGARTATCSTGENCAGRTGWYNTGSQYAACNAGQACTAQNQEYRSYGCSSASCTYSVTNTQVVYSGCSTCPSTGCSGDTRYYSGTCSGGSCTFGSSQDCNVNNYCSNSGSLFLACADSNTLVTRQNRNYNDYTCSGGSCNPPPFSYASGNCPPVDSSPQTCSNSNGWYGGGDANGCSTRDDPTSYYRSYSCSNNNCNFNNADSKDCDDKDGWYGGGNNGGCGADPSSEDRDYYATSNTNSCTYGSCGTKNCDSGDSCGSVCDGTVIKKYLDSYVVAGTGSCTSYYGDAVEDCASKASSDTDGDNPQAQGTVTDYTGCSGGSCASTGYTDTCTSSTQVREYLTSGASYTSYVKNCEEYEPGATYCSGSNRMRRDWGCSSGACSDGAASDSVVETCSLGCNPSTGQCYQSLCSPNPCTSPPATGCSGTSRVTYPNPGTCTQSGNSYSCSYPPTYTPCASTDCSGATRRYSGTCSGGSCTFGGTEDCAAKASSDTDGDNSKAQGTCTDYTGCSGGSCTSTATADECRDSNIMREYYASGASCASRDYDCRSYNSYYCSGSDSMQHVWGCTSSPGYCVNTRDVLVQACSYGCNSNTGLCNSNPCSPNPCTSPSQNTCSGNTATQYPNPGTCTQNGASYTCAYPPSTTTCPTTGCSGETRQSGGCSGGSCYMNNVQDCNSLNACVDTGASYKACSGLQACDAQNRLYNDYTCSSGSCSLASSSPSSNCPVTYSGCVACTKNDNVCIGSTLRAYAAASCSSGVCGNSYTDSSCPYGCESRAGDDACYVDRCTPNPCTSSPDDICVNSNTLNVYPSTGSCANSGTGSPVCTYSLNQTSCQYGCLSLSGDDQCAPNTAPTLNSVSAAGIYGAYAKSGHTVTMASSGSDPNGEQVRLRCGSSPGAVDMCTSGYASSGPSCSFTSGWSDSSDHNVYCFLQDTPGAQSPALTATLSADNSGPAVSITRSPSGALTPGTSVTLTASASDSRSGVSTMHVVVDGYTAATCSSTTCSYTFSPSYGNHTYYANAYDRVGNAAWAYDSFGSYPGDGPVGNGTSPPPGTIPGEGTTPPGGGGGSSCSSNSQCQSGVCYISGTCYGGGGTLPAGSSCSSNAQCASNVCGVNRLCYGGPFPGSPAGSSPDGGTCSSNSQCSSGICDATSHCFGGPGGGGSSCSSNAQCASRACDITGHCYGGGAPAPLPVNNPPVVAGPISYSGACREGGTITLRCSASDANQASNTLSVRTWIGDCNGDNCFPTRSWATGQGTTYTSGGAMSHQSGDTFTRDITITSADGTGIAATCQASDAFGATSNWGDAYPICVVNQCQNPPSVTIESIAPNVTGAGAVNVTFSTDRAIQGEPTVKIKPGSQRGGTNEITASQISKNGNRYVYSFTAQPSHLSGIADVAIGGGFRDAKGINCQFSQIAQMTIDTDAPVTTILCNNAPCSGTYTGPVSMVLNCNDNTTSCALTKFGIGTNAPASEDYEVPRVLAPQQTGLNTVTVNYLSTDAVGNAEQPRSQQISIYMPPCRIPSEEPTCLSGRIDEEVRIRVVHERPTILRGDTLDSRVYCFVRNRETKAKTRECSIDPTSLRVTIDRGTARQKDYFNYYYPGYDYPRFTATYDSSRVSQYLNERQETTRRTEPVDNIQYTFDKYWKLPIYTSVFQSEVCVGGNDQQSGQSGEDCGNYTVTDAEIVLDVSLPDLGVTVPRTTDGQNEANFTKGMPINFEAVPTVRTVLTSNPCTGIDCDVDFNFNGGAWKQASWSDFERAYLPSEADAASNSLACDQYATLNVKAVKVGGSDSGIEETVQEGFFVSCDPRLIVIPAERRLVLSAQPGDVFNVTAINPKGENKTFELSATTTDPNGYPLPWIKFQCNSQIGCEAGPGPGLPNDDYARLTVPTGLSRSVFVTMATAARSGSFPVTFVAAEGSNTFTATGTLLIFAEGLDEFAAWQLAGLMLIVVAILYYSDFLNAKKRPKRRK